MHVLALQIGHSFVGMSLEIGCLLELVPPIVLPGAAFLTVAETFLAFLTDWTPCWMRYEIAKTKPNASTPISA